LGICQLNRQLKSALEITVLLDLTLLQYELQFTLLYARIKISVIPK